RPSASIVRSAGPLNLLISAIFPALTATSPQKAGIPEPSTIRPLRINRSYAIATPFCLRFEAILSREAVWVGTRNERQAPPCPHGCSRRADRLRSQGEPIHNRQNRSRGEDDDDAGSLSPPIPVATQRNRRKRWRRGRGSARAGARPRPTTERQSR